MWSNTLNSFSCFHFKMITRWSDWSDNTPWFHEPGDSLTFRVNVGGQVHLDFQVGLSRRWRHDQGQELTTTKSSKNEFHFRCFIFFLRNYLKWVFRNFCWSRNLMKQLWHRLKTTNREKFEEPNLTESVIRRKIDLRYVALRCLYYKLL